jgi:hypothetical protein
VIQPFNPQIDQQVSQYQQATAFNRPGPRQVMAPQDRQFAEDQQDDDFMMGMARIGSQERTWANKNQLDFQNAENQRSFESTENEKQRSFMDNMRREEIERDNQRAQKLSQAMSERARLRLEAMKKSGAESMALLEEERGLRDRTRQYEAAMVKANLELGRQMGQDVQTPIRNQISNLDGQIRTVESMQSLLSAEGSATNALLESNVIARLGNYAYTAPTKNPGWFTNAEDLQPRNDSITPYLDDYGQYPGGARTLETEIAEGVTVGGMERMVKDISDTITRTVGGPGVGLKDSTTFSKGISRLVLASALNTRGELGDVQADVKEITDDLMRQGVSPHVIPVVLGHLEQVLTSNLMQEREAIQGMYPTPGLFEGGASGSDFNTISMHELSGVESSNDKDGRDARYRYNALATAVNGLRRARGRVEATGLALGIEDLVGQKTMYESSIQGFSGYDEENMFTRLSGDGVGGTLSRENLSSMLANRGLMDVVDMDTFDGDDTDLSQLRPAERELFDYITRFEGIRRDARSRSRDFKRQSKDLTRADEDLRIKRAQGQQAQSIALAEELAALGLPEGLGMQELMMLFGGLEG